MRLLRTVARANPSTEQGGGKPGRGRRLVQILALTALPASMAIAEAAKDPYDIPETETGIPVTDPLVIEKCGGCHTADEKGNLSRISWARTTPEGWAQAIRRMAALNGLSITPSETKAVIRSLSARVSNWVCGWVKITWASPDSRALTCVSVSATNWISTPSTNAVPSLLTSGLTEPW